MEYRDRRSAATVTGPGPWGGTGGWHSPTVTGPGGLGPSWTLEKPTHSTLTLGQGASATGQVA